MCPCVLIWYDPTLILEARPVKAIIVAVMFIAVAYTKADLLKLGSNALYAKYQTSGSQTF